MLKRTFGQDLKLIQAYDPGMQLMEDPEGDAMLIVSPKYQGKVFTSTTEGMDGLSIGWVNEKALQRKELDPSMNAYGGENRMWIGPEGSRFSVFFDQGSSFDFSSWKTPPAVDHEAWQLDSASSRKVCMSHQMQVQNKQGVLFDVGIERTVNLIGRGEAEELFPATIPAGIGLTAYKTLNRIRNDGTEAWTKESGTICIWMLDMFVPSDKTVILVPFTGGEKVAENAVTSDYFGEIPAERLQVREGVVFLKADGAARGKVGIAARYARPWAASFDAANNVFTYVTFDLDPDAIYLNQEWNDTKDPFIGDAVNAYNDGPLEDGGQLGPFYELESSSPAAFLAPGESLDHRHHVFHFSGAGKAMNSLVFDLTGCDIRKIRSIFQAVDHRPGQ